MKTTIKRAENQLRLLSNYLGGEVIHDKGVFTLEIGDTYGSGNIRCVSFNRCMTAFDFDIVLKNDIEIPLSSPEMQVLYFMYALEGNYDLQIPGSGNYVTMEKLQTAVVHQDEKTTSNIRLKKDIRYNFNLIGIDKVRYQNIFQGNFHGLEGKLTGLLEEFGNGKKSFHNGAFNLKIGELLKNLRKENDLNDISSLLNFRGICNLILANQISQYYFDQKQMENSTTLTKQELQIIQDVSDFIINYPEIQHSIKSLCSKSGISPNKLQEGFKFLHERTVSDFIRNVRIEKAEELIRTTDMNISEVVYSIGLTSRSYFCKIFKHKYHCSPKQYKTKALEVHQVPELV